MVKIVLRVPEGMTFQQETIDAVKENDVLFSRADRFVQPEDYIIINHGNQKPVTYGNRVKSAIEINRPEDLKLSISKAEMFRKIEKVNEASEEVVIDFPYTAILPKGQHFLEAVDMAGLPCILKPDQGHQGKGAQVISKPSDLFNMFKIPPSDYILQQYLKVDCEYRFNFFNGKLVNVSRKILPEEKDKHPGVFDDWLSLGQAGKLHKRAHRMAASVQEAFPFPSVAVDLLRTGPWDEPSYYFGEINTAYGLGPMTAERLFTTILEEYVEGNLDKFKVK